MRVMKISKLIALKRYFKTKRIYQSMLKVLRSSTRQKCAKIGSQQAIVCFKLVVHLLMEFMNCNKNLIFPRIIRLSYAKDSTKKCTVLMDQDANLSIKKLKSKILIILLSRLTKMSINLLIQPNKSLISTQRRKGCRFSKR